MKVEGDKSIFSWKKWLTVIVIAGVIWSVWFVFFSYDHCRNRSCFDTHLKSCERAIFIGGSDSIFRYTINGKSGDGCSVDVKLLQGKLDNMDSMKLEGKTMTCLLPFGVVVSPESNINVCHGLLKEGLQDLIIRNMHSYLVQNLGRLNLAVTGLPNVSSVEKV